MTYTPEQAEQFETMVMAINRAVIDASNPQAMTEVKGAMHAVVTYDPEIVMQALVSVAASVGAQSGNFDTPKLRRAAADDLRKVFLRDRGAYERMMAQVMAGIVKQ